MSLELSFDHTVTKVGQRAARMATLFFCGGRARQRLSRESQATRHGPENPGSSSMQTEKQRELPTQSFSRSTVWNTIPFQEGMKLANGTSEQHIQFARAL